MNQDKDIYPRFFPLGSQMAMRKLALEQIDAGADPHEPIEDKLTCLDRQSQALTSVNLSRQEIVDAVDAYAAIVVGMIKRRKKA